MSDERPADTTGTPSSALTPEVCLRPEGPHDPVEVPAPAGEAEAKPDASRAAAGRRFELPRFRSAAGQGKARDDRWGAGDSIDPTTALPPPAGDHLEIPASELEEWCPRFRDERFGVVVCPEKKLLEAVKYAISSHSGFSGMSPRLWRQDTLTDDPANASASPSGDDRGVQEGAASSVRRVMWLARALVGPPGSETICFLPFEGVPPEFFGFLRSDEQLDALRRELARVRRTIVLLARPGAVAAVMGDRVRGEPFARWNLSWLPAVLVRACPSRTDAALLLARLGDQRERKLWPADEDAFYLDVTTCLAEHRLVQRLEENDAPDSSASGRVIDLDEPLVRAMAFVASYFGGLSVAGFEEVLTAVLADAIEDVPPEPVATGAKDPATNDMTRTRPARLLRDLYLRDRVGWLDRARLVVRDHGPIDAVERPAVVGWSRHHVAFDSERVGRQVRDLLENRYRPYLEDYVAAVVSRALLFNDNPLIGNAVVKLQVEMALSEPARYGKDWLLAMISAAGPAVDVPVQRAMTAEDLAYRFFAELHQSRRRAIHTRIYELLYEMWIKRPLRVTVRDLLDSLLRHQVRDLSAIVVRLDQIADFDAFHWIKRLLDEGSDGIRDETSKHLVRKLRSTRYEDEVLQTVDVLRGTASWVPNDREALLSPSARQAIALVLDVAADVLGRPRLSCSAPNAPRAPLVEALVRRENDDIRTTVVRRLFHPHACELALAFRDVSLFPRLSSWLVPDELPRHLNDAEGLFDALNERWNLLLGEHASEVSQRPEAELGDLLFQALALADWFAAILQFGRRQPSGSSYVPLDVADDLLRLVSESTDPTQKRLLRLYWRELEDCLGLTLHHLADVTRSPDPRVFDERKRIYQYLKGTLDCVRTVRMRSQALAARNTRP